MSYKIGTELAAEDQAYVLRHVIDRRTSDARKVFKTWRRDSVLCAHHYPSDADWLAKTSFRVDDNGRIPRGQRVGVYSKA